MFHFEAGCRQSRPFCCNFSDIKLLQPVIFLFSGHYSNVSCSVGFRSPNVAAGQHLSEHTFVHGLSTGVSRSCWIQGRAVRKGLEQRCSFMTARSCLSCRYQTAARVCAHALLHCARSFVCVLCDDDFGGGRGGRGPTSAT